MDERLGSAPILRSVLGRQRRFVAGACLLGAAHQGGEALVPVLIGVLIDRAVATGSVEALLGWLGVLAALFLTLSTCYRFAARAAEHAAEHAAHDIRLRLAHRVLDPRGGAEAGRLPGTLVTIATSDAKRVGAVAAAVPFAVAALAGLLISAVSLLTISVPLGLLVLLGVPPLLLATHLVGKPLERRSGLEQEHAAQASGVAADLIAGVRVLKGIRAEPTAVARYRGTSRTSLAAALRAANARAGHNGVVLALTGLFIALVALVGAHLAMSQAITVGQLVAAVGLAQFLLTPFEILAFVNGEYAQGRASARRVAEVLAAPPAVTGGTDAAPEPAEGRLRLTALTYGAVRELDLEVPAGCLLGVVAPDPAVAADLLTCLGRFADPVEGRVELDGRALATMAPHAVRESIVVAAHDADLFEGTILDNVTCRAGHDPGPALAAAAAHEITAGLPEGGDTVLDERGRSLSGGQRQRIALARALATDAPVLVLHDPTTAVDTVTEAAIAAGIAALRRGRTTILVTTSPALLAVTDRVVVLVDGRPPHTGTHAELVGSDADYRTAVLR